jgi:hypothetical protein
MADMKYCRISTLMVRWDCSRDHIYDLLSKNILRRWPLPGSSDAKGTRISMATILELEKTESGD